MMMTIAVNDINLRRLATVFFGLGVYLLKSKFRIEDKLRFL